MPRDWLPGEKLGVGIRPLMAPARPAFLIMIALGLAHHSKSDTTTTLAYCAPGKSWVPHPNPRRRSGQTNGTNLDAELVRILAPS